MLAFHLGFGFATGADPSAWREWGTSDLGRRAKLYRLTESGSQQLAAETATWRRFSAGVSKVLFSR